MSKLLHWLRRAYNKSIHSIGFYPAVMAVGFLLFFIGVYEYEDSAVAAFLKQRFVWLNIRHGEAARTIVTTIAAGVIGLTVFSFSMVMVVMSQVASQMSNRILDNLIGNRFQQITLGMYIGTIIASFFLLSVIDDRTSEGIPSVTVWLLMVLTISDLFLFVFFLHYITQSVRYEKLIKQIHNQAVESLRRLPPPPYPQGEPDKGYRLEICSPLAGYFQGVNLSQLLRFAGSHGLQVRFYHCTGTYLLEGEPLGMVYADSPPPGALVEKLFKNIDFYPGQEIDKNAFYGFLHLAEVAIKALSPGINDPNTAVLAIHALTNLLQHKLGAPPLQVHCGGDGRPRLWLPQRTFTDAFEQCIYPVLDYGGKDRYVQQAFRQLIFQLRQADRKGEEALTLTRFEKALMAAGSARPGLE
jgi:uncharacterized membrane protein